MYLGQRDPTLRAIQKSRRSFLHKDLNFELDTFTKPDDLAGLQLLEAYMPEKAAAADYLPPFVTVEREVTNDVEFKLRRLAAGAQ